MPQTEDVGIQPKYSLSVSVFMKSPAPICCCVNYRTIKTSLNYPSKCKGRLILIYGTKSVHILQKIMPKDHIEVHTIIWKLSLLSLHNTVLFIEAVNSHSSTFVVQQQRDWNIIYFYLIKLNPCTVTWELALWLTHCVPPEALCRDERSGVLSA